MKARTTIIGTLTKDAENFIDGTGQNKCKFSVAVNIEREKGFYVDCFLNTHIGEEQLKHFRKGTLCTFVGKYRESLNEQDGKTYLNRTLNISDFYGSNVKSPFYKNMSVVLVGYLLDAPRETEQGTSFVLLEKPFETYGIDNNNRFTCFLPYKLSDKAKEMMKNDTSIFVYGYYNEDIQPMIGGGSLYIDRKIEVKDFEILDRPVQNIKIGGLLK